MKPAKTAKKLPNTRKFERLRGPPTGQWAMISISDPDWTPIQLGQWIRIGLGIRIQAG